MLNRRHLLSLTGSLAVMGALPARLSLADAPTDARFVLAIQRGAMDGLHAVPPYADPDYRALRGNLALAADGSADGLLDLDGKFGLHPKLVELKAWYDRGELLVVHAVATPYRERSHFDGQDLLENGTMQPHAGNSGWLNRAIGLMGGGDRRLGLALGPDVPLALRGETPVASWAPEKLPAAAPDFINLVQAMYAKQPALQAVLRQAIDADQMASQAIGSGKGRGGGGMMQARPGNAARILAESGGKLLAQANGPRIAVLELQGWDTHTNQTGRMGAALTQMNEAFAALKASLGPAWSKTVVMTATEFGRTARPNGSGGTDHGTATALFLGGGAVEGKRVIADWPGLDGAQLYQNRDLAPTTDFRSVAKAVLQAHLGLPQDALERVVFPESGGVRPMAELLRA
jgi:uncharacterized protein (DUF1501 family)